MESAAKRSATIGSMPERRGRMRRRATGACPSPLRPHRRSGMDPRVKPEDDEVERMARTAGMTGVADCSPNGDKSTASRNFPPATSITSAISHPELVPASVSASILLPGGNGCRRSIIQASVAPHHRRWVCGRVAVPGARVRALAVPSGFSPADVGPGPEGEKTPAAHGKASMIVNNRRPAMRPPPANHHPGFGKQRGHTPPVRKNCRCNGRRIIAIFAIIFRITV